MRGGRLAAIGFGGFAMAALSGAGACASSKTECSCLDTALMVHVPETRASQVADVAVSGSACAGSKASCMQSAANGAGCLVYRVPPTAAGSCAIDLDFTQGAPRFSALVRVVNGNACCGGFVADPPSAADVEVPG